jgi:hypothetical protein
MTLLTAAARSPATTHQEDDFGIIAAIAVIPLLMLVISVMMALQNPAFADILGAMG